ncbi:MAG: phosphoglycerate mutase, partial [Clostridia bacterium]|nr:phosphoglycerate mutase [Clostridia bacterium]
MKYLVLLYDGMADYPVPALDGKTPMEVAKKPIFDRLASKGEVGMVRTVAEGLKPGSDVANLSVMGYDPAKYYTGRSPLEAVSIGVKMAEDDIAMRCNVVTLSDEENYDD